MKIRYATAKEAIIIHQLAHEIWPEVYGEILSKEQLEFMLSELYSVANLEKEINENKHQYYVVYLGMQAIGYFDVEHNVNQTKASKLHKLYLKKSMRGNGYGSNMLSYIEDIVRKEKDTKLYLNVNRLNSTRGFYENYGFEVTQEIDIPIGSYFMEDFIMEKSIT